MNITSPSRAASSNAHYQARRTTRLESHGHRIVGRGQIGRVQAELSFHKLLSDKEGTGFCLVSCLEYERSHGKFRSEVYHAFHFVCHVNSTLCAGWLVCAHALSGKCHIQKGLRPFTPKKGTSSLSKHNDTHEEKAQRNIRVPIQLRTTDKELFFKAAVHAVVRVNLLLGFTENPGMFNFASALVQAGQSVPLTETVDVKHILPFRQTVSRWVVKLSQEVW